MLYIFRRKEGFYPLELKDDEEAIANAECNPGTVDVTRAVAMPVKTYFYPVWQIWRRAIASRFVFKTGRWEDTLNSYFDEKSREERKPIEMEIITRYGRDVLNFVGGPTGHESYYVQDLIDNRREGQEEMCICAGTINSWAECYVPTKEVFDFLEKNGFKKE